MERRDDQGVAGERVMKRLRRKLWSRVRASILLALLASLFAPALLCLLMSYRYVPILGRSASNWTASTLSIHEGWGSAVLVFDTVLGSFRVNVWSIDERFDQLQPSWVGRQTNIIDPHTGRNITVRVWHAPLWSGIREPENRQTDRLGQGIRFIEIGYGWPFVSMVSEQVRGLVSSRVVPGSGVRTSIVRHGAARIFPDRVWLPGAIMNIVVWFLAWFVLLGSVTWYRHWLLSRRWRTKKCFACGYGVAGMETCPECRTVWGELRPPIPAEAVEAGWGLVGGKGLRWIGWSVVPVVVLWLGLCALAVLLPWLVRWNHYTSEFWTVLRWGAGVTLIASALCSAAAARGIVLCAEAEGRRLGMIAYRKRTVLLLLGVACGVIGSMVGILSVLLSSQRTFYSWPNWNDAIAGGIAVVLLALFFVVAVGFVRRSISLVGDRKEGWRMALRALALLASCIVCSGFAWLSGMNAVSDVWWIWLVSLLVCGFAAIEAVVFCVRSRVDV